MSTNGTLTDLWMVVHADDPRDYRGIFTSPSMARDFRDNELDSETESPEDFTIQKVAAVQWDANRASIVDTRLGGTILEISNDYTSEPVKCRRELRARAIAKLTPEECSALNIRKA